MRGLNTDLSAVVWVMSVYLLTYAVPMLFTGRLGDRFGPKPLYLAGLALFTLASLWCGRSGTAEMLIAARETMLLPVAVLVLGILAAAARA